MLISLVLVGLLIGFAYSSMLALHRSIQKPIRLLDELSEGHLVENVEISSDELGAVMEAGQQLSQNLRKAAEFAQKIGNKDFDYPFTPASDHDSLGNALLAMRSQLYMAERTNQKRNWVTQGLAHFSDLIRRNSSNFEALGDIFLAELIQYLNANQGGIFIVQEPDEAEWLIYLDMVSCYAYNRKKYLQKRIKVHPEYAETLVGQAYLERETIYLKEVPKDYLRITSGLGDAAPATCSWCRCYSMSALKACLKLLLFRHLKIIR
ncbi:MAG: hypothetical protein HC913_12215 [Microscillaceae bacterium]|nr:hypothetical protein [Microscillaceae bacterium]